MAGKEAIPFGTLWETEIKNAAAQSVFFIPIITPTVVASPYCRFELESFLAREAEFGRNDLIFPILYIDVPALEDSVRRQNDPVLSLFAKRQYVDWRKLRHRDVRTTDVSEAVEQFCRHIRDALSRHWLTREELEAQERASALERAEAERKRQESEEAAAKRRAEQEEWRRQHRGKIGSLLPPSRPLLIGGSVLGLAILGAIGIWALNSPSPTIAPSPAVVPPAAVAPAPSKNVAETQAMKPGDIFYDCANCPQMSVVPGGSFIMGLPTSGPFDDEGPEHRVTIDRHFAVGRFALTFDEWDACATDGACNRYKPSDQGWGRGRQPVINVSWNDAKAYVAWLSRKTGKSYRLLSEAEYEYAARAGTITAYPWGNDVGENNANCYGCGSQWDNKQTAPVGSFAPNRFGLYDMVGNVSTWTEDCYHGGYYSGAPRDGSAWISGDCRNRVLRGGSWNYSSSSLRSASRTTMADSVQSSSIGFRLARTLISERPNAPQVKPPSTGHWADEPNRWRWGPYPDERGAPAANQEKPQ